MTCGHVAALTLAALALFACSTMDESALGAATSAGQTSHEDDLGESGEQLDTGDGADGSDDAAEHLDMGPSSSSCDPWAQDCPIGEKCSWEQGVGGAETRCVPVEPQAKPPGVACTVFGDPGSGYDDCALGSICTYLDERNVGVCVGLCSGSPASPLCTEEFASCQTCPDCPSLCAPLCDPLAQDCPTGFTCRPDAGSFACHPTEQLGGGALGDSCEYAFQCQAGYACVGSAKVPGCAGPGCCSPFCSVDGPGCPDNLVCTPWWDSNADSPPLPGLGVCEIG